MTNARSMVQVLGEPMRHTLLERLLAEPATATQLASEFAVTRSAISQHLQVMKAVGLVDDTAVGTRRVYAVDPGALALLRDYFDSFWSRSLDNFADAARRAAASPKPHSPKGQRRDR